MEPNLVFAWILIIGMLALLIYPKIYNSRNHIRFNKNSLKKDAKIVDIQVKKVGLKGEYKFRTTVLFSDGFEYISHYTNRKERIFYYTISLSENMKKEILQEAIKAHNNVLNGLSNNSSGDYKKIFKSSLKPQKYVCGRCRKKGPFDGNCPECGCSSRIYL